MSFASHVTCRLANSRVIAASIPDFRNVARGVLKVGRPFELLGFRLADNHLHAVVFEGHEGAPEFGRRVELSLQPRLKPGVRFSHVYVKPIATQSHLPRAFLYGFRQEERHGTSLDPLFEASNLPDLLGMRILGRWTVPHVRARLPRIGRKELEAFLPVVPAETGLRLEVLADAAAAAVGAPSLGSRAGLVVEARRAAVHVAAKFAMRGEIARHLGMGVRGVRNLLSQEPSEDLVRAVDAQLRLRSAWAALQGARRPELG